MKNRSCPDKIACWDYDASNCEDCAVGNLILRQKKSINRLKSELEHYKKALKIAATRLKCYGGLGEGFCAVSDCEYRHCGNDEGCVLAHLRKAAREIEEVRNESDERN